MMTSRVVFLMLFAVFMVSWSYTEAKPAVCSLSAVVDANGESFPDSKCTGVQRVNPQSCKCVDTCQKYGGAYQKIGKDSSTYIKTYGTGVEKAEAYIPNENRVKVCAQKCNELADFTCTAFMLMAYEDAQYRCLMFKTTVQRSVTFTHAEVFIRECAKPTEKRQLEEKIETLREISNLLEQLDDLAE